MNTWVLVLLAILASIILGYVTKVNVGFYALGFAYIIGCFVMGLKPKAVIAMWPMDIFMILFAVNFFYSFAVANGTLEKMAANILYAFRKQVALMPFVIFLIAHVLSAMGAGFYAILAFIMPFSMLICKKTGMNPVLGIMSAAGGAVSGGKFIISISGKVMEQLIVGAGFPESEASGYVLTIYLATTLMQFLSLVLIYVFTKQWKVIKVAMDMEKPEPFDNKQKQMMALMGALIFVMLAPYLLGLFVKADWLTFVQNKLDISLLAIIGSIAALLLKLGDEKKQLKAMPWGTLIMICGVGILIKLGVEAGLIEAVAAWVGSSIPEFLVPLILTVLAGIMSFFSSTTGVVLPTLYPMVPALLVSSSFPAALMFGAINIGSISTGISPFSSGGGIALSSCSDEESRNSILKMLYALPFIFILLAVIFVLVWELIV